MVRPTVQPLRLLAWALLCCLHRVGAQAFVGAGIDPKINRWLDAQLSKTVQSLTKDSSEDQFNFAGDGLPDQQPLHAGATVAATEAALVAGRGPRDDLELDPMAPEQPPARPRRHRSGRRRVRRRRRLLRPVAMIENDEDDDAGVKRNVGRRERAAPIDEPALEDAHAPRLHRSGQLEEEEGAAARGAPLQAARASPLNGWHGGMVAPRARCTGWHGGGGSRRTRHGPWGGRLSQALRAA